MMEYKPNKTAYKHFDFCKNYSPLDGSALYDPDPLQLKNKDTTREDY